MLSNTSPNTTIYRRRRDKQRTLALQRAREEKRSALEDLDNDVMDSSSESYASDGYLSDVANNPSPIRPTRRKLRRHTELNHRSEAPQHAQMELADFDNSIMQILLGIAKDKIADFTLNVHAIYLFARYNGQLMLESAYNKITDSRNKFIKALETLIPRTNTENAYEITSSQLTAFTFIVAILRITPRHIQQLKSLTDDATSRLQYIPVTTIFAGISSIFTASVLFTKRDQIQRRVSSVLNPLIHQFNSIKDAISELFTVIKKRNGISKFNNASPLSSKLIKKDTDINTHPAFIALDDQRSQQLANLSRHRNRALFTLLTMGVMAYFARLVENSLDLTKPSLELIDSPINTFEYANNTCSINEAPKSFLSGLSYSSVSNMWDTYNAYAVQSGLWLSNQYNQYRSTHKGSIFGETTRTEEAPVAVKPSNAVAVWFNPERLFKVNNTSTSKALSATVKSTSNRTSYLPAWAELEPTATYDVEFGPEVAPVLETVQSTANAANRTSYLPAWTESEPITTYDVEYGPEVAPVLETVQSTANAANRTSYLPAWTALEPTAAYDVEYGPEFPASEAARIQAELTAQEQELQKAAALQKAINKYALRGR